MSSYCEKDTVLRARDIIRNKTDKGSTLRELAVYNRIPTGPSEQHSVVLLFQQKVFENLVSQEKSSARNIEAGSHLLDFTLIQENDLNIFISRKMKHH